MRIRWTKLFIKPEPYGKNYYSVAVLFSGCVECANLSAVVRESDRVYIVACGTAYHAGLVGKTVIEKMAKIPYYTTIAAAKAAAEGIAYVKAHQDQNEEVNSLQGLHAQISDKL